MLARLGATAIICAMATPAFGSQPEFHAISDNGLEVYLVPEAYASVDADIRQIDIFMVPPKSAEGAIVGVRIDARMQINCTARKVRMVNVKLTRGSVAAPEVSKDSPWVDLADDANDKKTYDRMCKS